MKSSFPTIGHDSQDHQEHLDDIHIQHKRSYIVIIHRESQTILASYYHLSYDHYIYPIKDNCQSTVNANHNGCQAKDCYHCHHHHHDCYYQHDTY